MTNIKLDNITKYYYNNSKPACNDITFEVESGEFAVLLGPSGCGKTTVLRMIAGLEDISSGKLLFNNELMNNIPASDRDIGMVFQNYALYPHFTVFENIAFPLKIRKEKKNYIKQRVEEVALILELCELLDRKPKQLSGGQRQRVALGRAIVRSPRVFLFDEPLSNLDARLRIAMRAEITSLQRRFGTTSVYVTHDQTEAMTMGEKLIIMKDGILQQIATPEKVYNDPDNLFVAGFIGMPPMNFFNGKIIIDEGIRFIEDNDEITVKINNNNIRNISNIKNQKVILGIRPENIYIHNSYNENDYENHTKDEFIELNNNVKIDNVEFLGAETYIYFRTSSGMHCMRKASSSNYKIGEKIKLDINANTCLLFDDNGLRI